MKVAVLRVVMWLLGRLPLRANHTLGALLGELAWVTGSGLRLITQTNLQLCFPDMAKDDLQRLCRESLRETGKALTECAWLWTRPRRDIEARVHDSDSVHLFADALQADGGTLIITPHLGSWELCSLPVSPHAPMTYMYRKPRQAALDSWLIRWRANLGGEPASLDASGIKLAIGKLKAGGVVGILPDQEPDRDNGVFAPFFGVPANTMTLATRLAQRRQVTTLFLFAERLPKGQGWRVHFKAPGSDITSRDPVVATTALNQSVEACVREHPQQYMWNYKRFNLLPDEGVRDYSSQ